MVPRSEGDGVIRRMSGQGPEMSSKTREILGRARRMVPPMLEKFHKGEFKYNALSWPRPGVPSLSFVTDGGSRQLC